MNVLLSELRQASLALETWQPLASRFASGGGIHVAVMAEPFLGLMLTGKKTIESRFSKNKIAPYEHIQPGDLVLLKESSGPVVAVFTAGEVQFVVLGKTKLGQLQHNYGDSICADEAFWQAQRTKRYATLIEVTELITLTPLKVEKKNRLGWMKLR